MNISLNKMFQCECGIHSILVDYYKEDKTEDLGICIYQTCSYKTGKILKTPKLSEDVVLANKELDKFFKFIGNISKKREKNAKSSKK